MTQQQANKLPWGVHLKLSKAGRGVLRLGSPSTGIFLGISRSGHMAIIRRKLRTVEQWAPRYWEVDSDMP